MQSLQLLFSKFFCFSEHISGMDDQVFKQRYQKCKLRVKLWEKDFKKKNGRVPSKYDIREAPQDIRDSYKMYYKLKTSFLEDTLNDVLSDDGFDVLEMSQLSQRDNDDFNISFNGSISGLSELPVDECEVVGTEAQHCKNFRLPVSTVVTEMPLDEKRLLTNFEPEVELSLNKNAWGEKVSKKLAANDKKDFVERTSVKNLKQIIFPNTSFSKRNPRKSLSRPVLNTSFGGNGNSANEFSNKPNEALPDLETILLQKAKEQQTSLPVFMNSSQVSEVKTKVDEGWLNRNAGQNSTTPLSQTKTVCQKVSYGLSNIDVSKLQETLSKKENTQDISDLEASKTNAETCRAEAVINCLEYENKLGNKESDSDSVVGNSEDEKDSSNHRHIAKRRKIGPYNETDTKFNITSQNKKETKILIHDETSGANENSYKEENISGEHPNKRQKEIGKTKLKNKKKNTSTSSKILRKKKDLPIEDSMEEIPLNPEDLKYTLVLERGELTSVPRVKLTDLKKADSLAKEYVNNVLPLAADPVATKLLTPAEEKRAAEKRKLEGKIAAGKLNENFVTINIQKKTFVRGKKTINYSKYKKKLWKDKKKVAALTGPNMDMRGCDGGTLKCFTCGQTGHFAQNCKVKGDSLLPLSAQLEDQSPFPTLEEAEQMASQLALVAHSRNIDKLPQATNTALYQSDDSTEISDQLQNLEDDKSSPSDASVLDTNIGQNNEFDEELKELDDNVTSVGVETMGSSSKEYVGHKIPESFLRAAGLVSDAASNIVSKKFKGVGPLYDLNEDGSVKEVTADVLEVLKMFGHTSFRKGQDRAVMRILSGMSTLVTLSTGSGKSLCYQLPAYMYSKQCKAITLVISPLVSLMEDQVTGVPHFLRAHCLHTNQTPQQRLKIMQMISDGEVDVLLVSPEAVVSGERSTGFGSILKQLPPIAFACIDEAHCVSQWSHNFRPSYLMICKVLRKNLGVKCVLGLTATATLPTRLSIIKHLGITDGENGIISDIPLPDNLILSVSKDENKDASLLQLLLSKRFENCQSIIIYCTRRDECERVAGFLRTCLQDRKCTEPENAKKKRKRVNWHAEPYHAGMNASRRRTIQNAFMNNELRIVVATIAFGMGINKPDIRAVIHYNMPSNFESYVQEVGRAGRDNKISHCHLFLDANGGDKSELKRHIYANSLDRHVIRKLLQKVFVSCSCDKNIKDGVLVNPANKFDLDDNQRSDGRNHVCPGHEIGFSVEKTVEALDIPAENISTLLCYMELDNRWHMNVLSNAYIMAKVISYGGPKYLKLAAKECPPLAMAIAVQIKNGTFKDTENVIEFSVIDIAAAIGWNSGVVKYQLKNLEWVQVNGYPKRSPITVSFYDLGFRIKAPGDFTVEEIDEALDTLYHRSCEQEKKQLIQLQYVFQGLSSVAYKSHVPCCSETFPNDRSDQLKAIIRDYFRNDYPKNMELEIEDSNTSDVDLEDDVLSLISMYPENNFTGRNIARLFHGIPSPNYPAVMWYRCKYWRAHSKTDFNRIVKLANKVIVRRRI